MVTQIIFIITSLILMVSSQPISYQKVQFVVGGNSKPAKSKLPPINRNTRSFGFPLTYTDYWASPEILFAPPALTLFDLSIERGHFTPDYSNGLDYPDPLLLRGKDAFLAAKYLYGRGELFYHQIPHVRALFRNQEERRMNGLDGNYLSSNRPGSPFYRH